jgi:teichoic acid transport system permease protein
MSQTLTLLPQLLVLGAILIGVQQTISFAWLMLIPLIALLFVFNFGLAMIMARITVHVRDLNKLVPFISRILFYVSGVFFSVEKIFASDSIFSQLIRLNPIFHFLDLARSYLVVGYPSHPEGWITVSLWSFGIAAVGLIFFWSAEERYGRDD